MNSGKPFVGIDTIDGRGLREAVGDASGLPVGGTVGRIVEQLPDDLAPQAGVRGALQLHQHRYSAARDEEMVERPAARAVLTVREGLLAPDQQQVAIAIR